MRVDFLQRELKNNKMEVSMITALHLDIIRKEHPSVWREFKEFVDLIDSGELHERLKKKE